MHRSGPVLLLLALLCGCSQSAADRAAERCDHAGETLQEARAGMLDAKAALDRSRTPARASAAASRLGAQSERYSRAVAVSRACSSPKPTPTR